MNGPYTLVAAVDGCEARYGFEVRCTFCPDAPVCRQVTFGRLTIAGDTKVVECPSCGVQLVVTVLLATVDPRTRRTPARFVAAAAARAAQRQRLVELYSEPVGV